MGSPLGAISLTGLAGFAATLVLGAIVGVLLDHLLSPALTRRRRRRSAARALRRRRTFDYAGRPFEFDGVDLGLQVLFGTLGQVTRPEDVVATLVDRPWQAPPELRAAAVRYAERFGFYDGDVARLNNLDVETYGDARGAEHHRLRLELMPTGYFDMLATNVALGPFTPDTAPLLRGRGGLAETQLSNMIGLDLTLVTEDGHVPVFLRSAKMAALERCWQTSSGETLQLRVDVDTDGRPDIFKTARRGLEEELSIEPEQISSLAVAAFVATPEFANVGVLMYGELPLTARQLEARLNRHVISARDNWEYTEHAMVAIDDARALARALTDPIRRWTKQAAASLVFAHAYRANGNVQPLAEAIRAAGAVSLEPGSSRRDVLDADVGAQPQRHCWRCASALRALPPTRCGSCGQEHWANPKPCGEAVVVRDGTVLLVRRTQAPWKDHWDVPGGFCDADEHPMHAAERELHEELGLAGRAIDYLGTWMDVYGAPPRDGAAEHTANSAYLIELDDWDAEPVPERNEVSDVRWFPLDGLPAELAFPDHVRQVLALARLARRDPTADGQLPDRIW